MASVYDWSPAAADNATADIKRRFLPLAKTGKAKMASSARIWQEA